MLAGVQYSGTDANIVVSGSSVAETLQRLDNKFPIGFLYDYNGGIGLVGCKLNSGALLTGGTPSNPSLDTIIAAINASGINQTFLVTS